jgi:glyoxylase-like metal-dependent hydrolase (beta-lactamase superfamily II)
MGDSDMLYEEGLPLGTRIRKFAINSVEIQPGLFQVTHRGTNIYVIVEDRITLVDTGLRESAQVVLDFIGNLGRSPSDIECVILTHNHIDHMGGLAKIMENSKAKVAVHRLDIGEREHPPALDSRFREAVERLKNSFFSVMPKDVDYVLEGGETFGCLGGLEVIHTPGHTAGSISLYAPKHKLIMTGDMIRKHRKTLMMPPRMVSYNLDVNLESIKKIAEYDISTICFGHGLPLTDDVKTKITALIERKDS